MSEEQAPWHYATAAGATVGPITTEALAAAVASGDIAPDTAVWRAEYGDKWRAASTVPELIHAWLSAEAARVASVERDTVLAIDPPFHAFAESFRLVVATLFRPFSILAWLSLALCNLMASSRMMAGPGSSPTAIPIPPNATPAAAMAAVLDYLRAGVTALFEPHVSYIWIGTILIYGILTSYIAAKGRLLFVGKTFFPKEQLPLLWRRTIGRTGSLWRLYFILDVIFNLGFFWLLYRHFTTSDFAQSSAITPWFTCAMLLAVAVEAVRTAVFHFAEPLVFLLGIPVGTAARMAGRAIISTRGAIPRLIGFFAIIVACRIAYLGIVIIAATLLPPSILLPVAIVALLPVDFLIRTFGTRFLYVKCENVKV